MSEIRAALTPKRWAANERDEGFALGNVFMGAGGVNASSPVTDPAERHALAALALNGQPFGFTWADVDLLRRLTPDTQLTRMPYEDSNAADDLANRIAALLPPRDL